MAWFGWAKIVYRPDWLSDRRSCLFVLAIYFVNARYHSFIIDWVFISVRWNKSTVTPQESQLTPGASGVLAKKPGGTGIMYSCLYHSYPKVHSALWNLTPASRLMYLEVYKPELHPFFPLLWNIHHEHPNWTKFTSSATSLSFPISSASPQPAENTDKSCSNTPTPSTISPATPLLSNADMMRGNSWAIRELYALILQSLSLRGLGINLLGPFVVLVVYYVPFCFGIFISQIT